MTNTDELPPGSVFANQFRVIERIARGGMGTIYKVEQLPTGHPRALKVLQPQISQDPRARERFAQEAQIAARIESEHVAQVIAAGVDAMSATPWIAIELLQGSDLSAYLQQKGRLAPREVAETMRQLGHAISAAHRIGVIHRDLKPENIFIADARRSDASVTVKVIDFGVAKWIQEQRQNVASTAVVGSPLWMAPEQLETRGIIGPHTDVWALGLLAFAMLTGRSYWRSATPDRMSLPDIVNEIAGSPMVPASQRAAELGCAGVIPPGFDAWFARSANRDPAARFRSVDEQIRELSNVLVPGGAGFGAGVSTGPSMGHAPAIGAPAVASAIPATMAIPMQGPQAPQFPPAPQFPQAPQHSSSAPPISATMAIPSMATPLQGSTPSPFQPPPQQPGGHSATMAWMPGQTPAGQPFPAPGPVGPGMQSYPGQPAAQSYPGQPPMQSYPGAPQAPGMPGMPSWQGGGYPSSHGYAPAPIPGRSSSSTPVVALLLGVGGFLALGGAGLAFVMTRSKCDSGQHRSDGHCCVDGSDWDSARGACINTAVVQPPVPQPQPVYNNPTPQYPTPQYPTPQYPTPNTPTPPGNTVMTPVPPPQPNPTPTPLPTPPRPRPQPSPSGHACVGNWSGSLIESPSGSRGSMSLSITGTNGVCARWTEFWSSSGTRCLYNLVNCTSTPLGVRGTGVTSTPRCTGPVSASIICVGNTASFRETVGNVVDRATLSRR